MQGSCVPANGRRFTPACAGKSTLYTSALDRYGKNHPRVRGEECGSETKGTTVGGITPACAGKSRCFAMASAPCTESPPRARGRVAIREEGKQVRGITPACAGKRPLGHRGQASHRRESRNHPRVRGEESNENATFEGMNIPPKCKFFVLFRNVLRVPCDSRARGSKAIRLSSIRACYMLCVPNTRADHRVFHGGALFVSDIPVIAKWN